MLSVLLSKTTSTYSPGESISGDVVIYANTSCSILGVLIDKGVHTYPFSFTLPKLLPSSYNSPYGQIEYYIRVHFQTSNKTENLCKIFFVQALINVNMFTLCQSPKCAEVVKQCGFIFPKIFHLKASVSKTAFVPGDIIPVVVEVLNKSRQKLCYLFCTLVEKTNVLVQMHAETVNRITKKCLLTVAHKVEMPTANCQTYSWLCHMPTPSNLTATIAASTIVFVTYSIQVSAKISRVALPPETEIPVVFGVRAAVAGERRRRIGFVEPPRFVCGDAADDSTPSATHPRRRVTVSAQPCVGVAPTIGVGTAIASITTDFTRRVSVQLHSGLKMFAARPTNR